MFEVGQKVALNGKFYLKSTCDEWYGSVVTRIEDNWVYITSPRGETGEVSGDRLNKLLKFKIKINTRRLYE